MRYIVGDELLYNRKDAVAAARLLSKQAGSATIYRMQNGRRTVDTICGYVGRTFLCELPKTGRPLPPGGFRTRWGKPLRGLGAVRLTKARRDFADYLERTLIPDLKESGLEATAEDFEECVGLIRSGQKDPAFADWLSSTLIPDLKESGRIYTAQDFQKCVRFIRR